MRDLLSVYVSPLGDADRASLSEMLSDEAARKLGMTRNPQDVFDECVDALQTLSASIVAGKLPGFGPMRARYSVEGARELAASLDAHESLVVEARVASMTARRSMALTASARRKAMAAVNSLVAALPEQRDRIREDARAGRSADARIQAMTRLVANLRALQRHFSPTLLADSGLSPEVIDALVARTTTAAEAHTRSRAKQIVRQTVRGELSLPVGRMLFELRRLVEAAAVARRVDPTVPAYSIRSAPRRARTTPVTPTPAPRPDNP